MLLKNVLKYSWVPIFISLIIFYLCCLIPTDDIPDVKINFFIPTDKLVHFTMYFGLSLASAVNYIYVKRGDIVIWKMLLGAFLLPIIYGGLIEIIQENYFPPRSGDWYDFLADLLGSLAALPLALYAKKYLTEKYFNK